MRQLSSLLLHRQLLLVRRRHTHFSYCLLAKNITSHAYIDTQILQYALTLEYLENAFYTGALDKYDAKAFTDAGFAPWVRGRFEQIMDHEKTHVKFLQTALGSAAPQACNYTL